MRRDVFQAIADPVRREIIGMLVEERMTVNQIAQAFPISRPAISKHLKILRECGLVEAVHQGRERYCTIKTDQLQPVADWIEPFRKLWEQRLDSFESYLHQLSTQQGTHESSSRSTETHPDDDPDL